MNMKTINTGALIARLAIYSAAESNFAWCPPIAKLYKSQTDKIQEELCIRFGNMERAVAETTEENQTLQAELATARNDLANLNKQFDDYFDALVAAKDPVEMPRPEGLWGEFDSSVWAKQFMAYTQKPWFVLDEKTLDSWFAQALMTGYDKGKKEANNIPGDPNPAVWEDPADTPKCWKNDPSTRFPIVTM